MDVLSGSAKGLWSSIKNDRQTATGREITLWSGFGAGLAIGDSVKLRAGCDKRMETCGAKFANVANFRGFPYVPPPTSAY